MSSSKPLIQFYYDVISPYAWIGFEALLRYQKRFPVEIEFKPFFLREIMMKSNNRPPSFVPNKGAYIFEDLERNGRFYGLDIRPRQLAASGILIPKEANWLPEANKTTKNALKIILAVQKDQPEKLVSVSRAFWTRLWSQSDPIFSEEHFQEVLSSFSVRLYQEICRNQELEDHLTKNTQEALNNGCFGAPWMIVHHEGRKESFFGADRFHLIADLLGHQGFSYAMLRKL